MDKSIKEILKQKLLEELGNPTHFYQIWCNDDGWYVDEQKIETVDLYERLGGDYSLRLNGIYVGSTSYLFDKTKAQECVEKNNLEFWQKQKQNAETRLSKIDEEVVKEKAQLKARIEIAKMRLAELKGNK